MNKKDKSVGISRELHDELKAYCKANGLNIKGLLEILINEELDESWRKKK